MALITWLTVQSNKAVKTKALPPHGFLLGSILSCKGIVAKSYLDHNQLPYEKLVIKAKSQIKGKTRQETIHIDIEITVHGAQLSEKDIRYMTRIVDKGCTMANILTAGDANTVTTTILAED